LWLAVEAMLSGAMVDVLLELNREVLRSIDVFDKHIANLIELNP
jgi:hypothetical protein